MTTTYEIRGFLRPVKHKSPAPGCSINLKFGDQDDAEAVYRRLSKVMPDYELHLDRLETHTTVETIAGNAEFVKDCRSWGKGGAHARMIEPARRGHKRITGRALR